MKESKVTITIAAPPHEVWKVLTDLEHYCEWNPLFVRAKGIIDGNPSIPAIHIGFKASSPLSSKIIKVEPESRLEWFTRSSFVNVTHYFQLTSSQDGSATEFTQGERYDGWGVVFYSSFGTMNDARRAFAAMNNALLLETTRRREGSHQGNKDGSHGGANVAVTEKDEDKDDIAQLDISDPAAVAAVKSLGTMATLSAVTPMLSSMTEPPTSIVEASTVAVEEIDATIKTDQEVKDATTATSEELSETTGVDTMLPPATEKPEKRTSIIGAVSSLFSTSKQQSVSSSPADKLPLSSSKDEMTLKVTSEDTVTPASIQEQQPQVDVDDQEDNDDEKEEEQEDPVAKLEREAKNSERIELDLGFTDMSLGDFGF
ncbi:hypothetical protein BGZ98_001006 [Dissophora globulifera]|nr:hypothetical protein BGZ98_001006 [Dissophora globulifera]